MALILTDAAYLEIDLALPEEAWEFLSEFEEETREDVAAHLRLAFIAGWHAADSGSRLMRDLHPLVIKDPCESTP